jgi:hypothetical protein
MKPGRVVVWIALFFPLGWMALLLWLFGVFDFRASYLTLWNEHQQMMDLAGKGQSEIRSASGDTLADMFEYLSMAQDRYLGALQNFVIFGIIPTMIAWFIVGYAGWRHALTHTVRIEQ